MLAKLITNNRGLRAHLKRYRARDFTPFLLACALCGGLLHAADSSIELITVQSRELVEERILDGVVEPVNRATVSAQTSGQVTEVNYDVNDFVAKGSVLVRIREAQQSAQLDRAEAEVRAARARQLEASKRYKRAKDLFSRKTISQSDFDAAKASLDASKAQSEAAQAAVSQAKESLAYTMVQAPYDGIVVDRHVEVGETVNPGQALMTGFSLDQLRIRVEIPQRMIDSVRRLRAARIITADPSSSSFEAEGLTIFPYANDQSNTFSVRVDLPKGVKGLFPGMLAKVAFVTGKQSSLVVPQSAIVQRSEVTGVYVINKQGSVRLRQLRVGRLTDDGMIEVLAGLEQGEQIAAHPILAGVALKSSQSNQ